MTKHQFLNKGLHQGFYVVTVSGKAQKSTLTNRAFFPYASLLLY